MMTLGSTLLTLFQSPRGLADTAQRRILEDLQSISPNSSYLRTNLKRKIPIEKPISVHWLRRVTLPKINLSVS